MANWLNKLGYTELPSGEPTNFPNSYSAFLESESENSVSISRFSHNAGAYNVPFLQPQQVDLTPKLDDYVFEMSVATKTK